MGIVELWVISMAVAKFPIYLQFLLNCFLRDINTNFDYHVIS